MITDVIIIKMLLTPLLFNCYDEDNDNDNADDDEDDHGHGDHFKWLLKGTTRINIK